MNDNGTLESRSRTIPFRSVKLLTHFLNTSPFPHLHNPLLLKRAL